MDLRNPSITESEFASLWNKKERKKYNIMQIIKNGDHVVKIVLEDSQTNRKLCGKPTTKLTEEAYHWLYFRHRSLAHLLDIVTLHPKVTIFVTAYMEKSLREIIGEEKFYKNPNCYVRKKNYIEDVLWGLDYLHTNSLCLMNISDCKVLVCEKTSRAVISDFSCMTMVRKATKQAFAVPPFYRAPELDLTNSGNFDPIAAELWAVGVMALKVVLRHRVPWALVNYNWNRVSEIVDYLDLAVLKTANPESSLTVQDLEDFKSLTYSFFSNDPKCRCSARSAATSSFIQSSRCEIKPRRRKPSPTRRQRSLNYERNNRVHFQEKRNRSVADKNSLDNSTISEILTANDPGNQSSTESEISRTEKGTESQYPLTETYFHTCGKNRNGVERNDIGLFCKEENSSDVRSLKNCSASVDSGFLTCSKMKIEKHHDEKPQNEVPETSTTEPDFNPSDYNKSISTTSIRTDMESRLNVGDNVSLDVDAANAEFVNFEVGNKISSKGENCKILSTSNMHQNTRLHKSKYLSDYSICGDNPTPGSDVNTTENEIQFLQRSDVDLNPHNSENNSLDLIPFILSLKRRLEFIDAELLRKRNSWINSEINQESTHHEACKLEHRTCTERRDGLASVSNLLGTCKIPRDNVSQEIKHSVSCSKYELPSTDRNHAIKSHDTSLIVEESEAPEMHTNMKNELVKEHECNDTNQNSKYEYEPPTTIENHGSNKVMLLHKKLGCEEENAIDGEIKCNKNSKESIKTHPHHSLRSTGSSNDAVVSRCDCTQPPTSNIEKRNIEMSSLKDIRESFYCRRQYSYKRAVWEGDKFDVEHSTKVKTVTENSSQKQLKTLGRMLRYRAGRLFQIDVDLPMDLAKGKKHPKLLGSKKKKDACKAPELSSHPTTSVNKMPSELPTNVPVNILQTLKDVHRSDKKSKKQVIFNCLCIGN